MLVLTVNDYKMPTVAASIPHHVKTFEETMEEEEKKEFLLLLSFI